MINKPLLARGLYFIIFEPMQEQQPNQNQCASCGAALQGKFCSECGEKKLNEKDKSVMHFFEEFIHILTHADSKFLKSLKYLITKPGFLTSEHLAGRRKKIHQPIVPVLHRQPFVPAYHAGRRAQLQVRVANPRTAILCNGGKKGRG